MNNRTRETMNHTFTTVLALAAVTCLSLACDDDETAPSRLLTRDFSLSLPLFSPGSVWNKPAVSSAQADSDKMILVTYRVLRGDTSELSTGSESPKWVFMDVTFDDFSVALFRAGSALKSIAVCNYDGETGQTESKIGEEPGAPGQIKVPQPAGTIRPPGPQNTEGDGHTVLYDATTSREWDFWQPTTQSDGPCQSLGGGLEGDSILEAGGADYFDVLGVGTNADGLYSARASGTPLLAGIILPEEIERGSINHALGVALPAPKNLNPSAPQRGRDYYYPASRAEETYYNSNPLAIAQGQHIRLKRKLVDANGAALDEGTLAPVTRIFIKALRDYGAFVVDNANGFTFTAEDYHTARFNPPDAKVNELIGADKLAALTGDQTKWQRVMDRLNTDLERIPFAYGPWQEGQAPGSAAVTAANFEVVENATAP
jgi:hypothetical protein